MVAVVVAVAVVTVLMLAVGGCGLMFGDFKPGSVQARRNSGKTSDYDQIVDAVNSTCGDL